MKEKMKMYTETDFHESIKEFISSIKGLICRYMGFPLYILLWLLVILILDIVLMFHQCSLIHADQIVYILKK